MFFSFRVSMMQKSKNERGKGRFKSTGLQPFSLFLVSIFLSIPLFFISISLLILPYCRKSSLIPFLFLKIISLFLLIFFNILLFLGYFFPFKF